MQGREGERERERVTEEEWVGLKRGCRKKCHRAAGSSSTVKWLIQGVRHLCYLHPGEFSFFYKLVLEVCIFMVHSSNFSIFRKTPLVAPLSLFFWGGGVVWPTRKHLFIHNNQQQNGKWQMANGKWQTHFEISFAGQFSDNFVGSLED